MKFIKTLMFAICVVGVMAGCAPLTYGQDISVTARYNYNYEQQYHNRHHYDRRAYYYCNSTHDGYYGNHRHNYYDNYRYNNYNRNRSRDPIRCRTEVKKRYIPHLNRHVVERVYRVCRR